MTNEYVHIEIAIKKENYERLVKIVEYYNAKTDLLNKDWELTSVDKLIKGSIIKQIEEIETILKPVILKDDELNNEGKLKNSLQQIIKDNGLRQTDITELTGIAKTTLSGILNNRNQPSLDHFLRIWSVLGFPDIRRCFYRE
jgi:predicted XRE-type DNA-binding protein